MIGSQPAARSPPAYSPLDTQREQIRLLHLLPGSWEDPVSCTTSTVYVSDNPVFESLSYAWGDPSVTRPVLLNGHAIAVTVNLFAALRRLRPIWRRKHARYRSWAKSTPLHRGGILWLGEYSELLSVSAAAGENRGQLENVMPKANAVEAFEWLHRLAGAPDSKSISHVDYELTRRPEISSCVTSLQMLLSLPWWSRMWTLQEAVLPQGVIFVCGSSEITLGAIDRAQDNCIEYWTVTARQEPRYGPVNHVLDRLSTWVMAIAHLGEIEEGRDIVHALFSCKARQATNPRDKVYAVLGMFPVIARYMEVDYSKDTSQVSTELLLCLITLHGDLKGLLCAAVTPKDPSLPSWVPNWCYMQEDNMPGGEVGLIDEYDEGFAAQLTTAQVRTPCHGVLDVLGVSVDTVIALQSLHATSSQTPARVITESFRGWIDSLPVCFAQGTNTYLDIIGHMIDRMRNLNHRHREACIFITGQGHVGYAGHEMRINDTVHVLFGGKLPFVLRPSRRPQDQLRDQYYALVCHCYVHGIMNGEALEWGLKLQWFSLV
ncbi:hypothetical protein PG993_003048 [Apiospora rasikravindrae]|uniref:Heterokaryon incompatibility domain-containing protein n=1 Tax=Apiospora rasikravindrae TaxID=990691 RepID=A0ABR1U132_9PEZI